MLRHIHRPYYLKFEINFYSIEDWYEKIEKDLITRESQLDASERQLAIKFIEFNQPLIDNRGSYCFIWT